MILGVTAFGEHGIASGTDVDDIFTATWGHLAPKPKTAYSGWFVFISSYYGGAFEIVDSEFEKLPDSPWLFDDMMDYAIKFCEQFYNTDIDSDGLYIFEGYYLKKKNGEYKFSGETRKIDCRSLLRHER